MIPLDISHDVANRGDKIGGFYRRYQKPDGTYHVGPGFTYDRVIPEYSNIKIRGTEYAVKLEWTVDVYNFRSDKFLSMKRKLLGTFTVIFYAIRMINTDEPFGGSKSSVWYNTDFPYPSPLAAYGEEGGYGTRNLVTKSLVAEIVRVNDIPQNATKIY